ncbi:MAG: GAF domain-containing protein [Terriglobales bacterium]
MATHMADLEVLQELSNLDSPTPAGICEAIAKIFAIRPTEVGLLAVEGDHLKFLFPVEFQTVGVIPLSSSAVAARSAIERKALLFNRFPMVPHHTSFERIRLNDAKPLSELPDPIQKLMSAPIVGADGMLLGVVQVCRKGMTPAIAGADFTGSDLRMLESVAKRVAALMMLGLNLRREPQKEMLRMPKPGNRANA